MNKVSKAFQKALLGVEAALRRAAVSAKKQAEQQGTPYVVYDAANDQTAKKQMSKLTNKNLGYIVADRKDSVAGKPVFNRTVTLRDAWQK